MLTLLPLSFCHMLMQLGGAYLRYLPFRQHMEKEDIRLLWRWIALWSTVSLFLCAFLFSWSSLDVAVYKLVLFFAPVPYILLSFVAIKQPLAVHLFVMGMQFLWAVAIHTAVAFGENFLPVDIPETYILFLHPLLYLLLFLIVLPVSRRLFSNLLPSLRLIEDRGLAGKVSISLLPLVIFIGFSLPIADAEALHSVQVQLSRISIPVFFFLMYRGMSLATKKTDDRRQAENAARMMEEQLAALGEYERMLGESQKETMLLVGKIREDYGRLKDYLASGDAAGALALIRDREDRLNKTTVQAYSPYPILNAALSVYIGRAEALGIPVECSVSLSSKLRVDEHEFSIVLSNLLENAIEAAKEAPEGARAISVGIRHRAKAVVMEIVNPSVKPLVLDEKGLPVTSRKGHGLGMASLSAFLEKYGAYADFTQENDQVRFAMYWEGEN
ncbi:MAG: sensor histidine kinase [Schwartzia sp.]|nr:sensor histidine kinase [Schwartzia sp. (in: firmicutes)]